MSVRPGPAHLTQAWPWHPGDLVPGLTEESRNGIRSLTTWHHSWSLLYISTSLHTTHRTHTNQVRPLYWRVNCEFWILRVVGVVGSPVTGEYFTKKGQAYFRSGLWAWQYWHIPVSSCVTNVMCWWHCDDNYDTGCCVIIHQIHYIHWQDIGLMQIFSMSSQTSIFHHWKTTF